MASWNDLGKRPEPEPRDTEFDKLCAEVLTSAAGRELLAMLHRDYIEAVLTGYPDERALASHNAKRQLVRAIEQATARGLAARTRKHND